MPMIGGTVSKTLPGKLMSVQGIRRLGGVQSGWEVIIAVHETAFKGFPNIT
jgi:hypothetical protein